MVGGSTQVPTLNFFVKGHLGSSQRIPSGSVDYLKCVEWVCKQSLNCHYQYPFNNNFKTLYSQSVRVHTASSAKILDISANREVVLLTMRQNPRLCFHKFVNIIFLSKNGVNIIILRSVWCLYDYKLF